MIGSVDMDQFCNSFLDLKYADDSPEQRLDIVQPDELPEEPLPAIIYIHGGSWMGGDKRSGTKLFTFKIPSQGYVLATVNYRLAPRTVWPGQIHDVKAAVRYVRANAEKFNIDPSRIFVWGDSAGAHLAQLTAATSGSGQLEDQSMGSPGVSSGVSGVVSFYGVYNLTNIDGQAERLGLNPNMSAIKSMESPCCILMGHRIADDLEPALKASPASHIGESFPPILIQHGKSDSMVPYLQSVELYDDIKKKSPGTEAVLELFEGLDHADEQFKSDENVSRCLDFIDKHLYDGENPYRGPLPEIMLSD